MQFGKYRLIEKIGQGGMAEVFYAHIVGRQGFTKEVALKRVLPHLCEDPDFVESFVDEARLGGLLNHHHIVQTLDFGAEGGIYYIAMEYVHGLTLRELMNHHKRTHREIPPPIILDLALQLCDGLRYAHHAEDENGNPIHMVHRDLKPTNILLSSHGVIKIADFGIARAETNSRRTAFGGVLKGTAQYMSPEQAFGELHLDHRSDIFSLGSIIYELITLTPLFYDRTSSVQTLRNVQDAVVDEPLARMVDRWPFTRRLHPILRHMLAREPAERPSDISEIIPPLREIQLSLGMLDVQTWVEGIMRELGRPVRGRRPASKLNIPVAPPETGHLQSPGPRDGQGAPGRRAPLDRDMQGRQSAPTVAEPLPPLPDLDVDEATPVVRLKDIPGQPRLRDAPHAPDEVSLQDISVTVPTPRRRSERGTGQAPEATGADSPTLGGSDGRSLDAIPVEHRSENGERLTPTARVPRRPSPDTDGLPFPAGAINEEALGELPLPSVSEPELELEPEPTHATGPGHGDSEAVQGRSDEPPGLSSRRPSHDATDHRSDFLDQTPAWVEGTTSGTARLEAGEEPPAGEGDAPAASSADTSSRPGTRRGLLVVVGIGLLAAVALVAFAIVVLPLNRSNQGGGALRVTIDTVPGGAKVVFADERLRPGRTPLARRLPEPVPCLEVSIEHDGYLPIHRCLPIDENGFLEPVQLEPDPHAVGVIVRYPLDVEGLNVRVDDWELDLRQRMSRPNNQASIRTYVSPRRHRIRVTTASCGEVEKEFDFQHTNIYKFIKIVRSSKAPCAIAFAPAD